MKTMYPAPGYHHNHFVATHALGHMMYGSHVHHVPKWMSCYKAIVVITGRAHCFHDSIYIYTSLHVKYRQKNRKTKLHNHLITIYWKVLGGKIAKIDK